MASTSSSYGTLPPHNAPRQNGGGRSTDEEERSTLLPSKPSNSSSFNIRDHLTADVGRHWTDLILLFCYVITGLLDSSSIAIWGSFVSMQTGNTVYLGSGLAELPHPSSDRWIKSSISIGAFCLGSFCFSRFHRRFSPRRRWVLAASFTVQALLIAVAATIVTVIRSGSGSSGNTKAEQQQQQQHQERHLEWEVIVPLALVAFQSCGQAVTSRALQYNSLTSVVLTSIYCDLFSDAQLFALRNVERNRRVAAPLLLLLGAVLGNLISRSASGIGGALWTAAALKGCIVITWLVWEKEPWAEVEHES